MKKNFPLILLFRAIFLAKVPPSCSLIANRKEVKSVAENLINIIVNVKGNWGGTLNALVEETHQLNRSNRLLL